MRKDQICEMLWVMGEMTEQACNGMVFTEISTYVKNHCPGIEPEYIEIFRDFLSPIIYETIRENADCPGE